jgi:SAM-dependent methyltransferase
MGLHSFGPIHRKTIGNRPDLYELLCQVLIIQEQVASRAAPNGDSLHHLAHHPIPCRWHLIHLILPNKSHPTPFNFSQRISQMGVRLSKPKRSRPSSMNRSTAKARLRQFGGSSQRRTTARTGRRALQELSTLYNGLSGFHANTIGLGDYKTTYGEVTEQGIHTLSEKFRSIAPQGRNFYDLGSGIGRLVVGLAILNPGLRAHGIEIVPDRARQATQAYQRIRHRGLANRVEFTQGSFLDPAVDYKSASWVFISNLCLDEQTQRELVERLERQLQPGAAILCSKELHLGANSPLERVGDRFKVPMTWSADSLCSAYRVKAAS